MTGAERAGAVGQFGEEIAKGRIGERLWLYSNYHCNLHCTYCLTGSGPLVPARAIPPERLVTFAEEAAELGFSAIGITGGEPFLVPGIAETFLAVAKLLPTLVLSNGTLFTPALIARLRPLADLNFAIQISLDSAQPEVNDSMRGPRNFAKVVAAIPRLREAGLRVRLSTTGDLEPERLNRLCDLHRSLGIADQDHVLRPVVRRGRAADIGLGIDARIADLPPELTITADGAYWSPFGPTLRGARLDTDLLITRTTRPLGIPTAAMLRLARGLPSTPEPAVPRIR